MLLMRSTGPWTERIDDALARYEQRASKAPTPEEPAPDERPEQGEPEC